MNGPDFLLIGAMKCGTSSLAAQLGAQDGLFMTTPKEPNYFSDDTVFAKGPEWYASLFDAAAPGDLKGEASTHYTKRPDYPNCLPRMKAALPAPRLIYMIRNPMERLVSHYLHAVSENWISEPLERAIETYPQLVDYGLYGWQIAPFIEAYGREAVLLTSLERQKADPDGELKRIAAHIGLRNSVAWRHEIKAQNVSAERVRKFPLHALLIDSPIASVLRRTLVPKALRAWVIKSRTITERPEIPASDRLKIEARFIEDRAVLEEFFPNDLSLIDAYSPK